MKILCKQPQIESSALNTKILGVLLREGYARFESGAKVYWNTSLSNCSDPIVVDWLRVREALEDGRPFRNIGTKSLAVIAEWLHQVVPEDPILLAGARATDKDDLNMRPECPICRLFHEHRHGGLTIAEPTVEREMKAKEKKSW